MLGCENELCICFSGRVQRWDRVQTARKKKTIEPKRADRALLPRCCFSTCYGVFSCHPFTFMRQTKRQQGSIINNNKQQRTGHGNFGFGMSSGERLCIKYLFWIRDPQHGRKLSEAGSSKQACLYGRWVALLPQRR